MGTGYAGAVEGLLAVAGAIAIIGAAGGVIWRVILPARQIVKRVETLEQYSSVHYERLNKAEEYDKAVIRALIALLDHAESGNSTGAIKAAREALQLFLIDK